MRPDCRPPDQRAGWRRPVGWPASYPDVVDVWRITLDRPGADHVQDLSPDERELAGRFSLDHLRRRYVVAHATLRRILAGYVGTTPSTLRFKAGPYGKPWLAPPYEALSFNLAHSGALALLAVTRCREIGVDIEEYRALNDADRIAEQFFSAAEVAALRALPEAERQPAFFRCWARKEAFVKALGLGLAAPLDAFDVSLGPDEPCRLLASRRASDDLLRWWLTSLDVGPGYAAALVVENRPPDDKPDWHLRCWSAP